MDDNFCKQVGKSRYALSKAVLLKLTEIQARENPNLFINACAPGYVRTNLTGGKGKMSPEEGAIPTLHLLFGELKGSGWFFGSDCKRSPLHTPRDRGAPEFTGYKL